MTDPSLRDTWRHVVDRCTNEACPEWEHYGGRGVRVCDAWRDSYEGFLSGVLGEIGPKPSAQHTLDRRDNAGHYEPGNVRWATRSEQNRNRRNNRLVTAWGETLTLAGWAERHGVDAGTIWARLRAGWDPELAVRQPLLRRPKKHGDDDVHGG